MSRPPPGRAAALLELGLAALRREEVRFLLVGGLNTAFGYLLFSLLILLRAPYALAVVIGNVLGVLFNFKTTGKLVFGSHDNRLVLRFAAVYVGVMGVQIALLWLGKRLGVHELVTGAVILLPVAAASYLVQKRWVFGRRAPPADQARDRQNPRISSIT